MINSNLRKNLFLSILITLGVVFLFIGLIPAFPQIKWYGEKWLGVKPEKFVNFNFSSSSDFSVDTTEPENIDPRIIIPEIGVDMEIIYNETDEREAFSKGAWLLPGTAEPGGLSGNAVIAAHRYMFTSGSNTFYHLDKLKKGDQIFIHWRGMDFTYIVKESKIVKPDEVGILDYSDTPILTLFTCHPVYTTQSRLVVVAELIS